MKNAAGTPPPAEVAQAVRQLVDTVGEREAMRRLGLSRTALVRVIAGLGVRRGTIALCQIGLIPSAMPNSASA
jgi:hypothetical protein